MCEVVILDWLENQEANREMAAVVSRRIFVLGLRNLFTKYQSEEFDHTYRSKSE